MTLLCGDKLCTLLRQDTVILQTDLINLPCIVWHRVGNKVQTINKLHSRVIAGSIAVAVAADVAGGAADGANAVPAG